MKPGLRTTELLVTVATAVGAVAAALEGSLPPKWAAITAAISTAAYAVSRGLAKVGSGTGTGGGGQ